MFSWFSRGNAKEETVERLKGPFEKLHGHRGDVVWPAPRLVSHSDEANRIDQGNTIKASEYMDEPEVLEAKVDAIVSLLKKAKCCTAYTGAGLSRASGIGDYASKKNSINAKIPKLKSPYDAQPTYAHRVLVALERAGYLHHYVQQNHDGLPQKAGFPQEKINEIHGAWYDPSNPVVQFSGNLRTDFFEWMIEMEKKTDLCLCLGTSLSGMNADRIAETPATRSLKKRSAVLGTIIINLQQTRLDETSAIRVWAKLDDTFKMIAQKLDLDMTPIDVAPPVSCKDQFVIPYDKNGKYDADSRMVWDLRDHQKILIQNPEASNFNQEGEIFKKDEQGNYVVHVGRSQYRFGNWWPNCVMEGKWPFFLPFVNVNPVFLDSEVIKSDKNDVVMGEAKNELPESLRIIQTHEPYENSNHQWSLSVSPVGCVQHVKWELHPTFNPPVITVTEAPFTITRTGWGTFDVNFHILLVNGTTLAGKHTLSFETAQSETIIKVQ